MRALRGCLMFLVLCAGSALAQGTTPKMQVVGDTLIYDTLGAPDPSHGMERADADVMRALLLAHPHVTRLVLNSGGGSVWAAREMADIIIARGLTTHISEVCDSACVIVFLAGTVRSMGADATIGFHPVQWSAEDIERYYAREAERSGWDTPWAFAEWLHHETQQEVYRTLDYMISRGVAPSFAIQAIRRVETDMWRPHRVILRAAGVLTD